MDMGPIPFTAIIEYSRIYEVGDLDEFVWIIRKMDDKLLELYAKKRKASETKASRGKSSGSTGGSTPANRRRGPRHR